VRALDALVVEAALDGVDERRPAELAVERVATVVAGQRRGEHVVLRLERRQQARSTRARCR
jgi:hypothetical protein